MTDDKNLHDGVSVQRRICIAIANWLCGVLNGIAESDEDLVLVKELDNWSNGQLAMNDKLFVGQFVCKVCNHKWNSIAFARNLEKEPCPNCGNVNPSVIMDQNDKCRRNEDDIMRLENLRKSGKELIDSIVKLREVKNGGDAIR